MGFFEKHGDARKEAQKNALRIFENAHGNLVESQMTRRYTPRVAQKYTRWVKPTENPLRQIAIQKSVLYRRPPKLEFKKYPELSRILQEKINNLWSNREYNQQLTNGVGDFFSLLHYNEVTKKINVTLIPPHLVDVQMKNGEVTKYTILFSEDEARVCDFYMVGQTKDGMDYTGAWYKIDPRDRTQQKIEINPIALDGLSPLIWYSVRPSKSEIDKWAYDEIEDLTRGTLQIGELEAFHNKMAYLKSFKQATVKAQEISAAEGTVGLQSIELPIGPDEVITMEISSVALADAANNFLMMIKEQTTMLAQKHGISTEIHYSEITDDKHHEGKSELLRKIQEAQIKSFRDSDIQFFKVCVALLNKHENTEYNIDEVVPIIDYISPTEFLDKTKELEALRAGIELGVDSRVDFIYAHNAEIATRAEAEDRAEQYDEDRAEWVKISRALNAPADPADGAGQSPQENGAMGAENEDRSGANGRPIVPAAADPIQAPQRAEGEK